MIRLHNTFSKQKETFLPLEPGKVSIYLCGPTVYDSPHLGHGRSAVAFDIIRRFFMYEGFEVKFVSNYTDIDDKMIERAAVKGISVKDLTDIVVPIYKEQYGSLSVLPPDLQPYATEYIQQMIDLISKLESDDYCYVIEGDGVYFDVKKFKDYGKLSGQNLDELISGIRVDLKDTKRNPQDFVLWKFKKPGEPFWSSPWGEGRPGWHIECSAMTYASFGVSFDIHGGGLDLIFPHHECEIAQTQSVFGKDSFAKYWMHNGFITVDNEKMSKSLGNFFTLEEIFEKFSPQVVRFFFLQTHYRSPINFADTVLLQSKAGLERIHDFVRLLQRYALIENHDETKIRNEVITLKELSHSKFKESLSDDFDISGALGGVFELIKSIYILNSESEITPSEAKFLLEFLKDLDRVFAVLIPETESASLEIEELIEKRNNARESRDFQLSDSIRDQLLQMGIILEDTPGGTIWKKI